jgi:hypothetical protein
MLAEGDGATAWAGRKIAMCILFFTHLHKRLLVDVDAALLQKDKVLNRPH